MFYDFSKTFSTVHFNALSINLTKFFMFDNLLSPESHNTVFRYEAGPASLKLFGVPCEKIEHNAFSVVIV